MSADQAAFEKWAKREDGGLHLTKAANGATVIGRYPATYLVDETEIAWRAWANKPAAIAPPVAAGSVDTLRRFELVESQHGTGYMVHWDKELQEDADGEWVKHTDAIAWGAQRREEGWQSGRGCKLGIALEQRETQAWRERAEKAEFLLADALDTNAGNVALLAKADTRYAELMAKVGDLHCKSCGTHEISLTKECHNSDCAEYANAQEVYAGWKV